MIDMYDNLKKRQNEALTWLARNVHEWPATIIDTKRQDNLFWIEPEKNNIKAVIDSSQFNVFTKDQWLTRRAELQNKPNWEDAPEWAEYLAQDGGAGRWWFYSDKPSVAIEKWDASAGRFEPSKSGEVLGDWRDTLERRQQAANSEPNPEPSSDDWHKRGELPPVGVECEVRSGPLWSKAYTVGLDKFGYLVCHHFGDGLPVGYIGYNTPMSFRPLQSERERVASELVDVMLAVPVSERKTASESYMSMALAIYDHLHKGVEK